MSINGVPQQGSPIVIPSSTEDCKFEMMMVDTLNIGEKAKRSAMRWKGRCIAEEDFDDEAIK